MTAQIMAGKIANANQPLRTMFICLTMARHYLLSLTITVTDKDVMPRTVLNHKRELSVISNHPGNFQATRASTQNSDQGKRKQSPGQRAYVVAFLTNPS